MLTPSTLRVTETELISHVREWLNLLGSDKLADACEMLDEPNMYGIRWTPQGLRQAVETAFPEGSRFRRAHPAGVVFQVSMNSVVMATRASCPSATGLGIL